MATRTKRTRRRVKTCPEHTAKHRDPSLLRKDYYCEIGALHVEGKHANQNHLSEMQESLGNFPRCLRGGVALEIGCGVSPYARAIEESGWLYDGLDASPWAVNWMQAHGHSRTFVGDWACWKVQFQRGLIVAAHVIEHLPDAPGAIAKMATWLKPGGELWIIVPDDTDRCNPDHLWTFTEGTLRSVIERTGLAIEQIVIRQIVKRERFIYAKARKL